MGQKYMDTPFLTYHWMIYHAIIPSFYHYVDLLSVLYFLLFSKEKERNITDKTYAELNNK